jgi:hypothetical protein
MWNVECLRLNGWEGKKFIETQSDTTVGLYYFSVALYAILLLPNSLAIINQLYLFYHVHPTCHARHTRGTHDTLALP